MISGEMRGEEKPYEMPSPSQDSPQQQQQQQPHQQQQQPQHNSNLAIQQRLQHLSPVNPQKLSHRHKHQLTTQAVVALPVNPIARSALLTNSPSPSAASTVSNQSTGSAAPPSSSVTPPLSSSLPHPLDSLLTPAASPEDDSLETWIQTV